MYQLINRCKFHDAFARMGREKQFSYEAKNLLYDHLEDLSEDEIGFELDVIALCCEFSEDNYKDIFNTYSIECESESPTDEEVKQAVIDYLQNETIFLGETEDNNLLFQQF